MIPGNANPLLLASAAEAAVAPGVRSLRFNDGDSPYLNRTPSSAGNRKTWTWSGWVKRSALGTNQKLFSAGTSSNYFALAFNTSNQIQADSFGTGANAFYMHTGDMVFRDVAAWYSVVAVLDTTESTGSDRFKLYINGSQVTLTVGTNVPPSNADQLVNSTIEHKIGNTSYGSASQYFDGYLADIYFVDGLALTASSFGSYDSNGVWQRGTYSGTFGTNGFHILDFENEATIGHDSSGNSNDFTASNLSDTAGAGNDVLLDFPANGSESDTGAGGEVSGNYPVWNPLNLDSSSAITLSNGNLDFQKTTAGRYGAHSTIALPSSGKWYWEVDFTGSTNFWSGGLALIDAQYGGGNGTWIYQYTDQAVSHLAFPTNNGNTVDADNVVGFLYNADTGQLDFTDGTNTTSIDWSSNPITGTVFAFVGYTATSTAATMKAVANFGARSFAHTAPSGYKALNTASMSAATIADGSDYFEAKLYAGTGSNQAITGLEFSPDFVWIKTRNEAENQYIADIVRGAGAQMYSNLAAAEFSDTDRLVSFDSNGFTVGPRDDTNQNNNTFVAWTWDAGSSNTLIDDGSLNSTLFNQSAVWSTMVSPSPSLGSSVSGFDGDTTTTFAGGLSAGSYFTFTPTGGISFTGTIRVRNGNVSGASYKYNNGTATSFPANAWTTVATGGGTMTSFAVTRNTTDVHAWYAIEVDGKILVDQGLSSANTPSIESTVRVNQSAGISVVTYTNPSSGTFTVGHGLNAQVDMIIAKHRNRSADWYVWHSSFGDENSYINLNSTAAKGSATDFWGASPPGSSTFGGKIGTSALAGDTDLAIVFSAVAGYSAFGSYEGNGNASGPMVYTGFRPAFLLIKRTDTGPANWYLLDTARDPHNVANSLLRPNLADAELTAVPVDILSNGFKPRDTDFGSNASGGDYIYAAFAENPFQANGGLAR